jgi:hypothetical protein
MRYWSTYLYRQGGGAGMEKSQDKTHKTGGKRLPPVRIPLDFETAVTAFTQVDPKGPVREKPAKKKPRPKK